MREGIDHKNLKVALDKLADTNLLIHYDLDFYRLQATLLRGKEHEPIYDKSKTVQFIKILSETINMKNCFLYHTIPNEYTFLDLQKVFSIDTIYKQNIIISEKAGKTAKCNKRVML